MITLLAPSTSPEIGKTMTDKQRQPPTTLETEHARWAELSRLDRLKLPYSDEQMAAFKAHDRIITDSIESDALFWGASGHGVPRFDKLRPSNTNLSKLYDVMHGNNWNPKIIDWSQERASYQALDPVAARIFDISLARQVVLDGGQARAPVMTMLPHCTDPVLEAGLILWGFQEVVHSQSYLEPLKAVYADPSVIINQIPQIQSIQMLMREIGKVYDGMIRNPCPEYLFLTLVMSNALEGILFQSTFIQLINMLKHQTMVGTGKNTQLIARDEATHLAFSHHILNGLVKESDTFKKIAQNKEIREISQAIFMECLTSEHISNSFVFERGPSMGLTENIVHRKLDQVAKRRMRQLGLDHTVIKASLDDDELPWFDLLVKPERSQSARQEVIETSYTTGKTVNDFGTVDWRKRMTWDASLPGPLSFESSGAEADLSAQETTVFGSV